jgi:hypothetical protein
MLTCAFLSAPQPKQNLPGVCLVHPLRNAWFLHCHILQFVVRLQAHSGKLGSIAPIHRDMYQSRRYLHRPGCHWYCNRCITSCVAHTHSAKAADAEQAEVWPSGYLWCRVHVSMYPASRGHCANERSTIVTSIVRLIILLPALTTADQTWVIGEGSLWM